ncbi:MAG: alcohol dehydrogenase catalytic domain-containing protein [Actinomycetes bacterium]
MRHVVIDDSRTIRVIEAPDPTLLGPEAAIIEVTASGICGSDLHFFDGDIPVGGQIALGHEFLGTIVELGADVRGFRVGDRVLASSVAGCGSCAGCATLNPVTCVSGPQVFGSGMLGGGQATLVAVPAADFQLLSIPEGLGDEAALLLTDNLATGWSGAIRAEFSPGATVVVIGLGAVGLCAVRSAIALGAGQVIGIDPVPGRQNRAADSGATILDGTAIESVLDATSGRGADAVIDAVASNSTLDTSFACVTAGGTVSVIGVHDLDPYPLPILMNLFRSITLRTTTAPIQQTWGDLLPMVTDGRLRTDGIFTDEFLLGDAAAAYGLAAERSGDSLKVMLRP